jgi:hypothetical protein
MEGGVIKNSSYGTELYYEGDLRPGRIEAFMVAYYFFFYRDFLD